MFAVQKNQESITMPDQGRGFLIVMFLYPVKTGRIKKISVSQIFRGMFNHHLLNPEHVLRTQCLSELLPAGFTGKIELGNPRVPKRYPYLLREGCLLIGFWGNQPEYARYPSVGCRLGKTTGCEVFFNLADLF